MTFPDDFSLIIPSHTPLKTELACKIIPALLDENHPFKLVIRFCSGVLGKTEDKWVEVRADNSKGSYTVIFKVHRNLIVTLMAIISPTGSSWKNGPDSENPANYVSQEQWQALTRMLIPKRGVITIRPLFQIMVDGKLAGPWMDQGPSPSRLSYPRDLTHGKLFESAEEAEKVKGKLEDYWANALTREPKGKK